VAIVLALLSALAYGLFTCEEGLSVSALREDRAGVAWEVDDDAAVATVVIRSGFEAARLAGRSGAWRDRGNEGYVRVTIRGRAGACWTQPRFIAPVVGTGTAGAS
jgi:hypothetical protein